MMGAFIPQSLESRLRAIFRARGFELISASFCGPYALEVLYKNPDTAHYWSFKSHVEKTYTTNETRDAELERVITKDLDEHKHGTEEVESSGG